MLGADAIAVGVWFRDEPGNNIAKGACLHSVHEDGGHAAFQTRAEAVDQSLPFFAKA